MYEILSFAIKGDDRGSLIALEENKNIPFDIKRVYYIFNTKSHVSRGFHAHKNLQQVLIAISGSCTIMLDNGDKKRYTVKLNSATKGLLVGAMVWHEMHNFSFDCVLVVLASDFYNEEDYIRDYSEFLNKI